MAETKVVVIGAFSRNLPEYREDSRVVLWDPDRARHKTLPADATHLLTSRFVSHGLTDRLFPIARRRGIKIVPSIHGMGALRRELKVLAPLSAQAPPKPIPVDNTNHAVVNQSSPEERTMDATVFVQCLEECVGMTPPATEPSPDTLWDPAWETAWGKPRVPLPMECATPRLTYYFSTIVEPLVETKRQCQDMMNRAQAVGIVTPAYPACSHIIGALLHAWRKQQRQTLALSDQVTERTISVSQADPVAAPTKRPSSGEATIVTILKDAAALSTRGARDTQAAYRLAIEEVGNVIGENKRLRAENKQLRASVGKLSGYLSSLSREVEAIKSTEDH